MKAFSKSDSKNLRKSLHSALRTWNSLTPLVFDPLDRYLIFRKSIVSLPWLEPLEKRRKINSFLEKCIAELKKSQPQLAYLLRARFIDGQTILFLAHELNLSQDQVNRRQREAIELLAQTIEALEESARNKSVWQLQANLPLLPDLRLFGRDWIYEQLTAGLSRSGPPFIVALTGLGGIGKTALAQLAVHQLVETLAFPAIEWLTLEIDGVNSSTPSELARQIAQFLTLSPDSQNKTSGELSRSLARTLKAEARLIIIDGLDHAQSRDLLGHIHRWAGPSKFLLTGRAPVRDVPGLLQFSLTELDDVQAAEFLAQQIQGRLPHLEKPPFESNSREIYALIGGIPRALKLMAEKLRVWPLEVTLQAFAEGSDPDIERMYRTIYQPAWRLLTPEARQLMAQLPDEVVEGISYAQLQRESGIGVASLRRAISQLAFHSLLEVRGPIESPQYRVNRLTQTFMKTTLPARY